MGTNSIELKKGLATLIFGAALYGTAGAQTSGAVVQQQLLDAIALGQSTYTLPAGNIVLNSSLIVPPGTRNLTIVGQSGTRLVRSGTTDFPLIGIGNTGWHGFENSAFANDPQTTVTGATEGAHVLNVTGGAAPVPGWYAILGTDPATDSIRHSSGNTTYWFKRELIRVTAVNGNVVQLAQPLGRTFTAAELRLLEPATANANSRKVVDNVTIRNVTFDGRSPVNGSFVNKVVMAGVCHNLVFDDVSVSGYVNSGIAVKMSKGVTVNRSRISDGNLNSLGYGVELVATRFSSVRNTTFLRTRTAVLMQSGNMDALVEDCTALTSGFDVGHGTGELRLTYRRTVGTGFGIANPSWRAGVDRVLLEDCTALNGIHVYGGSSNVVIRGKHPSYPQTAPVFFLSTDSGGLGNMTAPSYVQSLTLENGVSTRGDLDGVNMLFSTLSNSPRMLGNLTIRNWSFTNLVTELGANLNLRSIANSPNILIENSTLRNTAMWSAPIWFGPNSNGGQWNLTLRNTRFFSTGTHGLLLESGATAEVINEDSTMNGSPFTNLNVRGAVGLRSPL